MHIAMISAPELDHDTDPPMTSDGQVRPLAAALADRGHQTTIYAPTDASADEAPTGVRIVPLPAGEPGDTRLPGRYAAVLADSWREDPPNVVHAFGRCAGLAVVAAQTDADAVPHVQDDRFLAPSDDDRLARLETALWRRADRVIVSSRNHADALAARGIPRHRLAVVPYGVDLDVYRPGASPEGAGDVHRLVCAGGYIDPGLIDLIHALPRIPDAEILITGVPTADTRARDSAAARVCALAERCGVADRARLLDDLDGVARAHLFRSADLVVVGPTWTATGLACLQAMACGAPVVTITPDGSDDTVLDGVSGELVPAGHADALADTVRHLLADPRRRMAYGIAGADRATVGYRWNRVACAAETAYTSATRSGRFTGASVAGRYQPCRRGRTRDGAAA